MAFPTIQSRTITAFNTGTSHAANYPATVNSGDLLLLFAHFFGAGDTIDVSAVPTGYTQVMASQTASDAGLFIAAKIADGTEDSGTITVTTGSSAMMVVMIYRITGWFGTIATGINVGTAATDGAGSANANPPNLDPGSWATEDTLWLAPISIANFGLTDGNRDITATPQTPSAFGNLQEQL